MKTIIKAYRDPVENTAINIQKANVQLNEALGNGHYEDAKSLAAIIRTLSEALYFMGEGKK